jgi:hypothetical protein
MSLYENSVFDRPLSGQDLIDEYEHTRPRHNGYVSEAAKILGYDALALARRFYRYRRQGMWVDFIDDTKQVRG